MDKKCNKCGLEKNVSNFHKDSSKRDGWENYGKYNGHLNYGWDIDHIVPISSAKTIEEVMNLNHYTNMQPLCSYVNRCIKRNKMTYGS